MQPQFVCELWLNRGRPVKVVVVFYVVHFYLLAEFKHLIKYIADQLPIFSPLMANLINNRRQKGLWRRSLSEGQQQPNLFINFQQQIGMNRTLTGLFMGHSRFHQTDELYQPLRQTLREDTTVKKQQLLLASGYSRVTHTIKTHTMQQNRQIAEHTLIQQNVKLHATHNTWKLPKDTKYCIINAQQKEYQPISEEQMRKIIENGTAQEVIVYTIEDEQNQEQDDIYQGFESRFEHSRAPNNSKVFDYDKTNIKSLAFQSAQKEDYTLNNTALYSARHDFSKIHQYASVEPSAIRNTKDTTANNYVGSNTRDSTARDFIANPQQQNEKVEEKANVINKGGLRRLPSKKGSGIMVTQNNKYNFFSAIDEPINNFLLGKQCICPANEVVAGPKSEVSWYGTIAR